MQEDGRWPSCPLNESVLWCSCHGNGIEGFFVLLNGTDSHCHDNVKKGSVDGLPRIHFVRESIIREVGDISASQNDQIIHNVKLSGNEMFCENN